MSDQQKQALLVKLEAFMLQLTFLYHEEHLPTVRRTAEDFRAEIHQALAGTPPASD
jgi:hypothetical protein